MPLSAGTSFLIILLVALTTFATRVTPFLIFPKGKEIPKTIQYLAPRGNHVGPQGKSRGPPGEITWAPRANHVGHA